MASGPCELVSGAVAVVATLNELGVAADVTQEIMGIAAGTRNDVLNA